MKRAEEEGVSPVIGVLLLVAITVVLAAIIAVFVFGMAGSMEKSRNIAVVSSKLPTGEVQVTVHGGQDLDSIKSVQGTAYYSGGTMESSTCNALSLSGSHPAIIAGDSITCKDRDASHVPPWDITRVVVVATFKDDTTQVVSDLNF